MYIIYNNLFIWFLQEVYYLYLRDNNYTGKIHNCILKKKKYVYEWDDKRCEEKSLINDTLRLKYEVIKYMIDIFPRSFICSKIPKKIKIPLSIKYQIIKL